MTVSFTRRDTLALSASVMLAGTETHAATGAAGKDERPMADAEAYIAVALQIMPQAVNAAADRSAARTLMQKSITRIGGQLQGTKIFLQQYTGSAVRLVVLPEYFLTSYPTRETISNWADKAAIAPDGAEYEALGKLAETQGVYLAGNAYETDTHFPGLYFQTSFIVAPNGNVVLRYRRLNSMFAPTPHDVWQKYLDIYGLDGVFPVAKTEIGKLAAIASEEILYPEIARCHALRGAEVFVHCSSEIGAPMETHKHIARRARAFENLAYVISANTAGIAGVSLPLASADGNSAVIDYKGMVLAESNSGETFTAFGEIDLQALRRARRKPGMTNYLARQRLELFADTYAKLSVHPANGLIEMNQVRIPDREYFVRTQQRIIERLDKAGII